MPGYDVEFLGASAGVVLLSAGALVVYLVGRALERSEDKARRKRWRTPSN